MHDWYDWLKDVVVPATTGVGALVVGAASLTIARRSHRLTERVLSRESDRDRRADRIQFGDRVRSYVESLRTELLRPSASPDLDLARMAADLQSAASTHPEPYAELLVSWVRSTMRSDWGNGSAEGRALMASTSANSLVDVWVRDPDDLHLLADAMPDGRNKP